MDKIVLVESLIEALQDEKVINAIGNALSTKSKTPKSSTVDGERYEQQMINKHVIFVEEKTEASRFLSSAEIKAAVGEVASLGVDDLKPRVFSSCLNASALKTKSISGSKCYLVEAICENTEDYVKEIEVDSEEVVNKDELNNYEELNLTKEDAETSIEALKDFENEEGNVDISEYENWLKGIGRKNLVKHVNKYKMKIRVEHLEDDELRTAIYEYLKFVVDLLMEDNDNNEEVASVTTTDELKKPKKDKKKKKNKKKKKK